MATLDQVVNQMLEAGLPALPPDHPKLVNKVQRFGPGKKAWYVLREVSTRNGRTLVTGAFGIWQGQEPNAVKVTMDWDGISEADRRSAEAKMAEQERIERERHQRAAELAANRAKHAWRSADLVGGQANDYLAKKRVGSEGLRATAEGVLLVPVCRYERSGRALVALQRIAADGSKRFSKGADISGAAFLLGEITAACQLIAIGEGYATCETARMATDRSVPVMVAFNAGNLAPVARQLRRDFPAAHLLFLADDDTRLVPRLREYLSKEFDTEWEPVIDGADHALTSRKGDQVSVRATWRKDAQLVDYIEADVRAGRLWRTPKFENAGRSRALAAAAEVGNASVVLPVFLNRTDDTWSDFNDLYLAEGMEPVREQLFGAISRAPLSEQAEGDVCAAPAQEIPPWPEDHADEKAAEPEKRSAFTLEWALAHCALVQGATDVWDSLNRIRMKRAGFQDTVGKDVARAWLEHPERRSISPRALPATRRGVAIDQGDGGADNIVAMLDRYTFLYGTKSVWDADKRQVIAYDAMSLARGAELASRWLTHPMRREVDLDKLVFDPTQRVDLETHINMFAGLPLTPRKDDDKAGLAVALLESLCSSEGNTPAILHWVLCWLAYPLQHPGAKMQTAVLFFGEKQGTGKSLFFEGIVKPIYGEYGATGGQHQLDAQYTHWRSQKLFVVFEEILSRQDKYSHFGLIKHMITGRDQMVTQKFKDDRAEANHMNVAMLSNEFQAVPIEPEDRRFLVAEARRALDEELRLAIKAEIEAGTALSEAFYAFLLEYPLGDFDPHTKPLMTPSKERMINFGRQDWDAFYLTWRAGELAAPFCSCLSADLYVVYARYCNKYGFRQMTITKFSELIAQRIKKDRQWVTIGTSMTKKLLTVFHVPWTDEKSPEPSLSKQCQTFRDLAEIKE